MLQTSTLVENTSAAAQPATDWRNANAAQLAAGLRDVRSRSLAIFDAYMAANALDVPCNEELNPPLWELGHIGWFQEFWIARNPQRDAGIAYDHALASAFARARRLQSLSGGHLGANPCAAGKGRPQ